MTEKLLQYLTECDLLSRRKLLSAILDGMVSVNGKVVKESGYLVKNNDSIVFFRKRAVKQERQYYAFNKPIRVITTMHDDQGRRTVADFFREKSRAVPVGRLDFMTSGLLIVTNDGSLMYKLMHPKYKVQKEYLVSIDRYLSDETINRLRNGVEVDGKQTSHCIIIVKNINRTDNGMLLSMTLHEGRNREIRKMIESVGAKVLSLNRIRYKTVFLGNLKSGKYRRLTQSEIESLRNGL